MEKVRLGIIGIGSMGTGHAGNVLKGMVPDMELTAVADIRQSRLDWARNNLPETVKVFDDGRKMIDSGSCDAVLVATPHYLHPEFVIYALEHGLHAISEKPAGVYTKQVREMNEAAERSDRSFAIMLNQRTNCVYRKLHEMIQSEGKWHDIEVEDDVTAYMEFENGATGVFVTTTADAPGTNRLELTFEMGKIVCEEGRLFFDKLSTNVSDFCKTEKEGFKKPEYSRIEIETDGQNEQHIGVLKAFAGHILRGTPLVAEGTEGIRGLTLSNAMHLSSWLDRTVELPLDEELFLRELNKKRATSRKKEDTDIVFDTTGTF